MAADNPAPSPRDEPAFSGPCALIVGAGPAGLMAAEVLSAAGVRTEVHDAMPSAGRKFLLAGRGGLNLTHAEPLAAFVTRYGERTGTVARWLDVLSPTALRAWAEALGIPTFVGTSQRVFPQEMKAAPLLRAWLHRLRTQGVRFHMRHRWQPDSLGERDADGRHRPRFDTPDGERVANADVLLLALGGASWPHLGSDGRWAAPMRQRGVDVAPLVASNCGVEIAWSPHLIERHAGAPLKGVRLACDGTADQPRFDRLGECVVTATGLEGSLVYAAGAAIRAALQGRGAAEITLDLLPQRDEPALVIALKRGRGARSLANHLKEQAGLSGAKAALLREGLDTATFNAHAADATWLADRIKHLPLRVTATRPVDEAISTAGGVRLEAMSDLLELQALPGVYCAGEMLDWDAPTGGYLLTAAMASGRVAARGALHTLGLAP